MKALVTGGAGFIGSHLVDYLIARGDEVIVVDSLIEGHIQNIKPQMDAGLCEFIKGDIRNKELMLEKLPVVDIVFHLAADPDVRSSVPNPIGSFDHNMNGTMNVLEYIRKNGIKKMIFTSSGGTVYGEVDKFPVTEDFILMPISPYGASKAAAEMYLSAYANAYEIKIASVRYANIFGDRSLHGVGCDFFKKLSQNPEELEILGDGTQQKSYLYVSDAVEATVMVADQLDQQIKWYDAFNVGSDDWFDVKTMAGFYEAAMGLENVNHIFTGGERGWVGDVAKMLLSLDKIKLLGYSPKVSCEDGIRCYVAWLQEYFSTHSLESKH